LLDAFVSYLIKQAFLHLKGIVNPKMKILSSVNKQTHFDYFHMYYFYDRFMNSTGKVSVALRSH